MGLMSMTMPAGCRNGGKKMHGFLTPEEMMERKKRQKILFYVAIPIIPIVVGAGMTILLNGM